MIFAWRLGSILFGAVVALALGITADSTAAPIKPEKEKGDEYSKKLVGVWEATEVNKKPPQPDNFTMEIKAGGELKITVMQFELVGTWKRIKEEGKNVTIDADLSVVGVGKGKTVTLLIAFENADEAVISVVGDKPEPKILKRKK
jgi:hypothetical protein